MDIDALALQELRIIIQDHLEQGVYPDEIMHELREDITYNIGIGWNKYSRTGMEVDYLFYAKWLLADDLLDSFISEKDYRQRYHNYYSMDKYKPEDPFLIVFKRNPQDYDPLDVFNIINKN